MKVVMFSREFPASHPKAGMDTHFVEQVLTGLKKHTIRSNRKGKFRTGDIVSCRYWSGKPYRSKQVEFARARLKVDRVVVAKPLEKLVASVNGKIVDVAELAARDGLSVEDFEAWFVPKMDRGYFVGSLIWLETINEGETE